MILALLLVFLAVAYRIATGFFIHSGATWLSEFAPGSAIALCCAAYFPTRYKFSVPLGALFISDLILNLHYRASLFDAQIVSRYFAFALVGGVGDRKSTRLNSSHLVISYAVFCLKKKNTYITYQQSSSSLRSP